MKSAMGKKLSLVLAFIMLFSVWACNGISAVAAETRVSDNELPVTQSDQEASTDDSAWERLESIGRIVTENGIFYVYITMPAEFIESNITQESIDAEAGERYTSGILNEDGSVTYKLTKAQHRAILENITESIDESLQEMVDSSDYTFTRITHNDDFTVFDAFLSTNEVSFTEGFAVIAFYMYGGIYALLAGNDDLDIEVNYHDSSGNIIYSANSSDLSS